MPPRLPRVPAGLTRTSRSPIAGPKSQVCLLCSGLQLPSRPSNIRRGRSSRNYNQIRRGSVLAPNFERASSSRAQPDLARRKLHDALLDLQKYAGSYVNISRLQLALRGLEQQPGQETIRIAILALADGGSSLRKAKELLRLIAADPLKSEEGWEHELVDKQLDGRPVLLKIGHEGGDEHGSRLVKQININSPMLSGHKLEILVLEMDPPANASSTLKTGLKEAVLVPTIEIPTSSTGRYTPVTTPVHKALIVGDGIIGASRILSLPIVIQSDDSDLTWAAMDLRTNDQSISSLPFKTIDLPLGSSALALFRQSVENALKYEQDWFASRVPEIVEWIKSGSSPVDGDMKESLRRLITSILDSTQLAIEAEQSRRFDKSLADTITPAELSRLKVALADWAERAHTELRDQLDIAFSGRRWRKLGWWKLFWRVDDVSMIASDILAQRFLTDAEKETIFLFGRIYQSGIWDDLAQISKDSSWAHKLEPTKREEKVGTVAPNPRVVDMLDRPEDVPEVAITPRPWPLQIPITRGYMQADNVPALQALAQKLVLQTLTTSAFASAFSGLIYVSTISTGLYEAGAVAAFGIVWSLKRMQTKWEAARHYWEGEVREEGRKAIRGTESELGKILVPTNKPIEGAEELGRAFEAVSEAQAALETCK